MTCFDHGPNTVFVLIDTTADDRLQIVVQVTALVSCGNHAVMLRRFKSLHYHLLTASMLLVNIK